MISVHEADEKILDEAPKLDSERIELACAPGRILAEDIFADSDLPPFDRSQMDGYALRADDTRTSSKENPARLKVVGESVAGKGWDGELESGEAVRIMTGARVPRGADSIQKVELTKANTDRVEIFEGPKVGQFIVPRSAEISVGTKIFSCGDLITAEMMASLASFGCASVSVGKQSRVSIIATGSELVEINETPKPDQIRNSNTIALKVLAENCGANVETFPIAGDDFESLKKQISILVSYDLSPRSHVGNPKSKIPNPKFDIVVLTGGVSMGDYDFTKPALRELGAEIFFEKVALKPGKPTVFAKLNETLVFALPGNPVSAIVTFLLFVRPAILKMQGANEIHLRQQNAILSRAVRAAKDRESFLPAKISTDENARLICEPLPFKGSSDFVSFAQAQALARIPVDTDCDTGSLVEIWLLP